MIFLDRLTHEVLDYDNYLLRRFTSYALAKQFIENKPGCKVKKIKFDLTQMEECLF